MYITRMDTDKKTVFTCFDKIAGGMKAVGKICNEHRAKFF